MISALWANARRRKLAIGLAIAIVTLLAHRQFSSLTDAQTPRSFFDSQVYFQIAEKPLGLQQFFYAKPAFVPLVYRAVASSPPTIAAIQAELAFAAWTILAFTLVLALRRWWVRAIAGLVSLAFVFAGPRVGYTGAILSESINDSLLALVAAGAIGLTLVDHRRRRIGLAVATGALALAWIFTRDTNAITTFVIIAVAAVVWPAPRWWSEARWAVVLAATVAIAGTFALGSTRVDPPPLEFQQYWAPSLTARGDYPMVDNIMNRVMVEDRAWLAERGAPVEIFARQPEVDKVLQHLPEFAPAQAWLVDHGSSTYLRWLLAHPIDRTIELVAAWDTVLAGRHRAMMPPGWTSFDRDHVVVELFRKLTTNRWIVLALLIASPLLLRRPRRNPLCGIASCVVVSGLVGAAASYYGDAIELSRHCYGAGQQIVLGLFVAVLAWLDRRGGSSP